MSGKCEICANSRIVVSENDIHPICCLSEKKAIDCIAGVKDHYIGIVGEWKFDEKITEVQDLGDVKFVDEKGHIINRDDALDWNETPPFYEESEGE